MTEQLRGVQRSVRRGRQIIAGLAASLVLDVALTAVVSVTAVQAHDASTRAAATVGDLRAAQVAACQAGNQTRAQEVRLWVHLAAVSAPQPGLTPAQKARNAEEVAQLLAYIRSTFAPRDCRAAYAIPRARAASAAR
jgi:hypothetical protein